MWKHVLGVKPKRGWFVFWLFFKIGLYSAISFKRSRRELSVHVAEHRSVLKNYQNTLYSRFIFITKTGRAFPKAFFFTVIFYKLALNDCLTFENVVEWSLSGRSQF